MFDHAIEQSFDLVEASKRCKGRGAFLNKEFTSSAGFHFFQPGEKIVARNLQVNQFCGCRAIGFNWHAGKKAAQCDHADFLSQRFQVSADKTMRMLSNLSEVDIGCERHGSRVNSQNLQTRLGVWNTNFNFAIKAARTPQRRIKHLRNVGSTDNNDLTARDKSIHQTEQLGNHSLFNLTNNLGSFRSYRVNFIDEENRWGMTCRFLEDLAQLGLALAIKLQHDLRSVEVNEVDQTLSRHGASQQSFSRARRAVQKHAFRCKNSQPLEDTRIFQRQFDHLAHSRNFTLKPTNIFIGHGRGACRGLVALDDSDVCALSNHYRTRRNGAYNLEVHRLRESRNTHNCARDNRNAFQILEHTVGRDGRGRSSNPQWRQAHCYCLFAVDSGYGDLLLQASAAITANGAVDLDHAVIGFSGNLGASNCGGATGDLQHIAGLRTHALQIAWR